MHLSVLTLFPELIRQAVSSSVTGRALEAGLFRLSTIQIRDFAVNRYGKVDDYCYGGGTGMLMMAEPVWQAWQHACSADQAPGIDMDSTMDPVRRTRTIYLSPRGRVFCQADALRLASAYDHIILLCGHYEGIDQRVTDAIVDEELSIGDYILTGGELAACVIIDALLRLVPGVLPDASAYEQESHMNGLLEHPHYTRPPVWRGQPVPDVLLSGHQAKIDTWRQTRSILDTMARRPDLMDLHQLDEETWLAVIRQYLTDSPVHEPELDDGNNPGT